MINNKDAVVLEENIEEQGSKPLCETLRDFDSVIENLAADSTNNGKQIKITYFNFALL